MNEATSAALDDEGDDPTTQPSITPLPPTEPGAHAFAELTGRVSGLETTTAATDGRVTAVEGRLDSGEKRFGAIESRVEDLHTKQDKQTEKIDRILTATEVIATGVKAILQTRMGRAIAIGIGVLILAWLAKHGVKLEVPK